jgi:hypothetical protein
MVEKRYELTIDTENKYRVFRNCTDKKYQGYITPREVVDTLNNQHEIIQQLQDRIKSLDKPLTQIMLLLLDDEFRSKLTDVEWEAFEELSKFNGDIK